MFLKSVKPWSSYPQVLGHLQQLLPQAVEGGEQQTHTLVCGESSLWWKDDAHCQESSERFFYTHKKCENV